MRTATVGPRLRKHGYDRVSPTLGPCLALMAKRLPGIPRRMRHSFVKSLIVRLQSLKH